MRNAVLGLLLLCALTVSAQDIVRFTVSKPYCLFNFMETASGAQPSVSKTLETEIRNALGTDQAFCDLCSEFRKLQLHQGIARPGAPAGRKQESSVRDLLHIALVHAKDLPDFQDRACGMLPNQQLTELCRLLRQAEPYYDRAIWNESRKPLDRQRRALEEFSGLSNAMFRKFQTFYNASWAADIPFLVALYPIRGKDGNSTATPHANSLCVGVFTHETAHAERMGVVLHEMCHVLYDEQPPGVQQELQRWFDANTSPFAPYAYLFLDEALATALGNGWAFQELTGRLDTADWYGEAYVNRYAKALYPQVAEYLKQGRSLDQEFIDAAIADFARDFPDAMNDFALIVRHCSLYADIKEPAGWDALLDALEQQYRLKGYGLSAPVADPESLGLLKDSDGSQLVIVSENHEANFKVLRSVFPEMADYQDGKGSRILGFRDRKGRVVLVFRADTPEEANLLFPEMKHLRVLDTARLQQFPR